MDPSIHMLVRAEAELRRQQAGRKHERRYNRHIRSLWQRFIQSWLRLVKSQRGRWRETSLQGSGTPAITGEKPS